MGRPPAALLGTSPPPGQRPGREWRGRDGAGERSAPLGTGARVGCALPLARQLTHHAGGQSRDVCPTFGAGRGVAGGGRRQGCRSDQAHGGARPPLRRLVAQTQPGNLQREGQSWGGAGTILASHVAHPRTSDVAAFGRCHCQAVQR